MGFSSGGFVSALLRAFWGSIDFGGRKLIGERNRESRGCRVACRRGGAATGCVPTRWHGDGLRADEVVRRVENGGEGQVPQHVV
ncbi:hypothetical protein [uncultured Corynebacterium sp.]|uniref:hypothetical protein n=1 Tax=uncultured Corynebacterium sp. TaxID=159447 RepID=UPI00260D6747|nr:hypothetical protein [uncultured Corynebacterium sp.]